MMRYVCWYYVSIFLWLSEHVPPSLAPLNEHLMFGVRRLYAFQQALEYGAFTFQGYEIRVFYAFLRRWTMDEVSVLIKGCEMDRLKSVVSKHQ